MTQNRIMDRFMIQRKRQEASVKNLRQIVRSRNRNRLEKHKSVAEQIFTELNGIECEISTARSTTLFSTQVFINEERNSEYLKIVSDSRAFRNDKEKLKYLLKELENALVKIEILELDIKSLKRDNDNWRSLAKVNSERGDMKEEIRKLRGIVVEQESQLELFKKAVIEKYCT